MTTFGQAIAGTPGNRLASSISPHLPRTHPSWNASEARSRSKISWGVGILTLRLVVLGERHVKGAARMISQRPDVNLAIENLAGGVAQAPLGAMVDVWDLLHGPIFHRNHASTRTELVLQRAGRLGPGCAMVTWIWWQRWQ